MTQNLCKTKPGINYETLDSKNTLAQLITIKINALMKLKHRTMKLLIDTNFYCQSEIPNKPPFPIYYHLPFYHLAFTIYLAVSILLACDVTCKYESFWALSWISNFYYSVIQIGILKKKNLCININHIIHWVHFWDNFEREPKLIYKLYQEEFNYIKPIIHKCTYKTKK